MLVVDEMPLRRALIAHFLERWAKEAGKTIVVSSIDEVIALNQPVGCCLVILSLGAASLSEPRPMAAKRVLAAVYPDHPVIVMGDRPDQANVETALRLGAAGYIPTSLEADVAIAALTFILAGGSFFPPDALASIGQVPEDAPPPEPRQLPQPASGEPETSPLRPGITKSNGGDAAHHRPPSGREPIVANPAGGELTSRQRQVLACLEKARSNKEIARELAMSEATVKVHVRQVMKKLGASNRTHAAVLALKLLETVGGPLADRRVRVLTSQTSSLHASGVALVHVAS